MADEAILNIRLSNIERDCHEIKEDFREFEDRLDNHSERINDLEYWHRGNGGKGAEERLQSLEGYCGEINKANLRPRVNMLEADVEALQKIADSAIMEGVQGAVKKSLDAREKTTAARLKFWGPIIIALITSSALVLQAVL